MTEQIAGTANPKAATDKQAGSRAGVTIERVFSTEGVHPYDELTWERRDVVQTNWKTGETVFEQRGVEFPSTWSVNASTIVTTKYFRGAVGTDAREWSLKQLIDRVVSTYVRAGLDHGYFTTPADATVFEHELTWRPKRPVVRKVMTTLSLARSDLDIHRRMSEALAKRLTAA